VAYEIEIHSSAQRSMRRLPSDVRASICDAIDGLADEPRPRGCEKVKGADRTWRIKVRRDYRVVYEVDDDGRVVRVTRVGNRSDIYRGM